MTKRYTADDFANARFAEHEDGRIAARMYPADVDQWFTRHEEAYTDKEMAVFGWVPVPTKPTITERAMKEFYIAAHEIDGRVAIEEAARSLGYEVIPDPEPTNTDRLEQLIRESDFKVSGFFGHAAFGSFAKYLNDHGVTAPHVKDN